MTNNPHSARTRRTIIRHYQARINELEGRDTEATIPSIITVRFSRSDHLQAKKAAAACRMSLNQFCVAAIVGFAAEVLEEVQAPATPVLEGDI